MKLFVENEPFHICYHIQGKLEKIPNNITQILLGNNKEFIPDEDFLSQHIEIGPRRNFKTSWNSNVCQIFKKSGIDDIESIEFSTFYPTNYDKFDKMLYEKYKEYIPENQKYDVFYVDNI